MQENYLKTTAKIMMPPILYGTAWKKEQTKSLVIEAIASGFRGIDTACQPKHYNEPLVGEALKEIQQNGLAREELFIQTKFTPLAGQDPHTIPYDKSAPLAEQVADSFAVSKKNLHTDYIDSYLLHSPLVPYHNLRTVWRAMEQIQKSGEARQLGISNIYELSRLERLYEDAAVKPAVIQNRFYAQTDYDRDIRAWCHDREIIYESFWTLTANPHILGSEALHLLAKKYQKTVVQIFFRYLNQVDMVPLTGTTSLKHMQEDVELFDFELRRDEMGKITALLGA